MPQQITQFVFQSAHSTSVLMCHLTAVGIAAALIMLISRYERTLVSRSLSTVLLTLRLAVLAIILITLLQPTLTWKVQQKQTGRILVGIDVSGSMGTIDQHASKSEKLRLARGLELIGNAANEERLNRWQKAFDANAEPEWVEAGEIVDDARRSALADSRRKNLLSIFEDLDTLSRSEIARRLLIGTNDPLLDRLNQLNRVELFLFAGNVQPVEREGLAALSAETPSGMLTQTTDLSLGLQSPSNQSGEVTGTILFTDGRDLSHKNLPAMAASLKATNSPVFPVLIGSSYRPRDLSIQQAEHPQAVYKGDHPRIKVTVGAVGFPDRKIDVELVPQNEDGEPIRQSIQIAGTSATVEFDLDAPTTGRKSYLVRTPVLEGEMQEDNNSRSFAFNVVDDRARVLLIEGEARWEFRYIDNALARDERIELTHVLFDQPHLGVLPEPFFPRQLVIAPGTDQNEIKPFAEIDLMIVGDASPEQMSDEVWQQVLRFVSEGGTLVLSAGKRYLPLAHRSPALAQMLPVSSLVPVSLGDATQESSPRQRGLPIQLNADGEQQPMLQFAPDLAQNIAIWKGLPGQMWAMLGDVKPSATVWATTIIPADRFEGLATDRKWGVIVHQYVGSGQVLWVGIDATWRWRYRVGDTYHHRFWAQMARWAAANKMSAGTDFVRFGVEKSDIEAGQSIGFRARWTGAFLNKFSTLKVRAEIFRKQDAGGQPVTAVDLAPLKGQPLVYEGRILSLPAGEYLARMTGQDVELGDKPIEATFFVQDRQSDELMDVSTNRDLLMQIANASGGRLFLPDELKDLPRMFRKVEESLTEHHEITLWDRWPLLVVLFLLMTSEWILRKLNGLP